MKFEFKPSFKKSIKFFPAKEKKEIKTVTIQLIDMLSQDRSIHKGVRLKRLRGNFWEVRKGIKARILFKWEGDLVEFILVGNHNDIKRFLKNV